MFVDFLKAAAVTIAIGLPVFVWGDAMGDGWWKLPLLAGCLALSMVAGIATFARKYKERIIPIASIYVVVMFAVLLFLAFEIAWHRGQIEF